MPKKCLTVKKPKTSKWLTVIDFIGLAEIEDFEFFSLLKKGLPVYTSGGFKRIVDKDTLPLCEKSVKYRERLIRGAESTGTVMTNSGFNCAPPLTEAQIKAEARAGANLAIPENCIAKDFTLSQYNIKRDQQIQEAMTWWVKMDDALEFAKEKGLLQLEKNIIQLQNEKSLEPREKELEKEVTESEKKNNVNHKAKLRLNQIHKIKCREVAKKLWKEDPSITIADMSYRDEINKIFDGRAYAEKTIREWIKDLCPNRKPGRRS